MTLGAGNLSLTAAGGNVTVFALGKVTGSGANNNITARSGGTDASFTGGGIEIGAGLTSSSNLSNRTNQFIQPPPGALDPIPLSL